MITHTKLQMAIPWRFVCDDCYYVEHPDGRPHSNDGWGNASEHVLGKKDHSEDPNKNFKADEEPVEETPVEPEVLK